MGRPSKSKPSTKRKIVFKPAWDDTTRDHRREFRLSRDELVRNCPWVGVTTPPHDAWARIAPGYLACERRSIPRLRQLLLSVILLLAREHRRMHFSYLFFWGE